MFVGLDFKAIGQQIRTQFIESILDEPMLTNFMQQIETIRIRIETHEFGVDRAWIEYFL